ncbi:MAG: GNAT family N-acetyltransferase [Candidatus Coproplasma sp.]
MDEIDFKKLTLDHLISMRQKLKNCPFRMSDYTTTFKFMWQKFDALDYAVIENSIVFMGKRGGRAFFYYPVSDNPDDELRALDKLESYCLSNNIRLQFAYVPREKTDVMLLRYGTDVRFINDRRWRDYLYNANDFITYGGKKFAGQRNHVNKFKKNYPSYSFVTLTGDDRAEIFGFLKKFEERQLVKDEVSAREELSGVYELLPYMDELEILAGAIKVDGEIIAVSMGERCADTLIISVEKALVEYDGVYQVMAQEFAKKFAADGVNFINREDDSGDAGLRKSKLQYNPVRLVEKYEVFPARIIDRIPHLPVINAERVTLKEIDRVNALEFYRLEYDGVRNKYWGYDWREHFSGEPTPEYFMHEMREDFNRKDEMPLGIYLGKVLIGEVVLHNFGYANDCEIGVRVLPEYEGKGYAREAVLALIGYAFYEVDAETVYAKCYKQNVRSAALFPAVGFRPNGEDEKFYYFKKTAAM